MQRPQEEKESAAADKDEKLTLILASRRLNMGAFLSMSGMIMNLTLLPLMKTCSSCDTLPSWNQEGIHPSIDYSGVGIRHGEGRS